MKKHSFSSNRLVTILISFFLIIWVSNQLNAGVICVSNTGDNDNTGTPGSPFLTIQKALDSASAGDTIKIAAGIYTEYLNTKCSNILLGGYNESYTNNKRDIFLNKTYIVGASSVMYYDANSSTIDGFVFDCGSSVTDAAAKLYNGSVLSHNVFLNLTAIAANNIETYGGAVVINNTVYEGSNAIVINSGTGTPLIKNNIFCYTSFGINTVGYDASVRTYNCVYGNTFSYTGFDSNPGNGDIAMNPVFRDVNNYDFRILEISSCLDKGDPSDSPGNEPHPYNSRIDIGAYGGTAWSPYLTPIPDAPSLCVPANNLENASRDIILKWNDIEEIDSFHVQVTTDPSFVTGIIMDDDAVSDTALVLTDLLYHKTYFWRVNASVTLGTGEWSEVWQFSTIELDQPALYLPSDRKINPGEFMWFSTANADNYIIQFSTDSLFTGIVLDSLLTDTIYSGDSLGNNTYYWRIKALNADDESPWSVIRSFIINSELLFCEDFESYPPGILADAPGSPWIRYSSSRVGDVINTNVHEGDQCFQINSFTTSTEIDYVKFDWEVKPAQLGLELWYNPDGYFIYKDFAEIGLGYAASKFDMDELIDFRGSEHNLWFSAEGRSEDTIVFNEMEYDKYNHIKVEFDFQDNEARIYAGLDCDAPLRATVGFNGAVDINSLYFSGGLNPTYIDDIYVMVEGEYVLPLPDAPLLLFPVNESVEQNTTQTLTWQSSLIADTYQLQVDDALDFSSPLIDQQHIESTSYQLVNLEYDKTYYWRVRAVNESGTSDWSETWSFNTLVTPVCDYDWTGYNPPVAFDYVSANKYNVKIILTDVGTCSKLEIEVMSVTVDDNISISYSYPNYGSLSGSKSTDGNTIIGSYSIGNSTCGGSKSGSWSAYKLTSIPEKPILTNPSNNAVDQPVDVTLEWNEVDNAAGYALEVSESQTFATSLLSVGNISSAAYDISLPGNNTMYYWKVGSKNVCDEIQWSDTWRFTTKGLEGMEEPGENDQVILYPNPATYILYIDGIEYENTKVSVCTIEGKTVKQLAEKGITQIDLSDLQEGTYLLKIINSDKTYVKKIIIQ